VVTPVAGRVVGYSAGEVNVHCVQPVEAGVRHTFIMWFTKDPAFREDDAVLRTLLSTWQRPAGGLPDTMYLDTNGVDIRVRDLEEQGLVLVIEHAGVGDGAASTEAGCVESGNPAPTAVVGARPVTYLALVQVYGLHTPLAL
jgi:hypothetical protein